MPIVFLSLAFALRATGDTALTPIACNRESTLKSISAVNTTSIQFVNGTSDTVKIYWLDYMGTRVLYQTLSAGASYIQSTFLTQPWVVTTSTGSCISIFLPVSTPGLAQIDAGSSGPPSAGFTVTGATYNQFGNTYSARVDTSITFQASETTNSPTFAWDFGDTSKGAGRTITHVFRSVGSYTVKLTVTTADGSASSTAALSITSEPTRHGGAISPVRPPMPTSIVGREVQTSRVTITNLSTLSADPFSMLTIEGKGFAPATSAISVLLTPDSGSAPHLAVPAFAATESSVSILVPPVINSSSGEFSAASIKVQVVEVQGDVVATSNVLTGLVITTPPALPANVPAGAITSAFLTVGMNVSSTVQALAAGEPSLGRVSTDLGTYNHNANTMLSKLNSFMTNGHQGVAAPTSNGKPFTLDANSVMLSDRLILAYISQFAKHVGAVEPSSTIPRPEASSSTACPTPLGDAFTDNFLCNMQQYHQTLASTGAEAVGLGAQFEFGFYTSFLGGWAVDGFAEAGALGQQAAEITEFVWDTASSFIASYVTATPPPSQSDTLLHGLASVLDRAVAGGIGILPDVLDSKSLYDDASELLGSTSAGSPDGGLILTDAQTKAPAGATAVYSFEDLAGVTTVSELAAQSVQAVTSAASALLPPAGAPSISFTASPLTIATGQASTLIWTTTNATAVSISGIGTVALNGSQSVSPTVTTTYTLNATGSGGASSAAATVTVTTPAVSLSPPSASFDSSGGSGSVTVMAPDGYQWDSVANNDWITITAGDNGTGTGEVDYSVAANSNTTVQNGSLTIAGLVFLVTEAGNTTSPWDGSYTGTFQENAFSCDCCSGGGGTTSWGVAIEGDQITITNVGGTSGAATGSATISDSGVATFIFPDGCGDGENATFSGAFQKSGSGAVEGSGTWSQPAGACGSCPESGTWTLSKP